MTFNTEKNAGRPMADYDSRPEISPEAEYVEHEGTDVETDTVHERVVGRTAIVPVEDRATTGYGLRHGKSAPSTPEGLNYSA